MLKLLDCLNKWGYFFKKNIALLFLLITNMIIVLLPVFNGFVSFNFDLVYRNITDFFYNMRNHIIIDFKTVFIDYLSLSILFINLFIIYSIFMQKVCSKYKIKKTNNIQTSINVISIMVVYKFILNICMDILYSLRFNGIYDFYSRIFIIEKNNSYYLRSTIDNLIYCAPLLFIIPFFIKMILNPYKSYYEVIVYDNVYIRLNNKRFLKKTLAFVAFLPIYTLLTSLLINILNNKFSIIFDLNTITVLSIFPYVTSITCYIYYLVDDLIIKTNTNNNINIEVIDDINNVDLKNI